VDDLTTGSIIRCRPGKRENDIAPRAALDLRIRQVGWCQKTFTLVPVRVCQSVPTDFNALSSVGSPNTTRSRACAMGRCEERGYE